MTGLTVKQSSGRLSVDPDTSRTPTLQGNDPVDVPLQEKSENNSNPEAPPDETPQTSTTSDQHSKDVLIVDWDGPDDPQNPQKCASYLIIKR